MRFKALEIDAHYNRRFGIKLGIHLDFQSRMSWIYFPFFTIYIYDRGDKRKEYDAKFRGMKYIGDKYVFKRKVGKYIIKKHFQPHNRDGFFNIGCDYINRELSFHFWNYIIFKEISREK